MSDTKFDLNTASIEDLKSINGIGQAKAEAIISTRKKLGGFKTIEDLAHVPRLGNVFIKKYQSYFNCKQSSSATKCRNNVHIPSTRLLRSSDALRSLLKRKHSNDEIVTRSSSRHNRREDHLNHTPSISKLQSQGQSNTKSSANQKPRSKTNLMNKESLGQSSDETEKIPSDVRLDLLSVFGEGSRTSKRLSNGQSNNNLTDPTNQVSSLCYNIQSDGTKPPMEVDIALTSQNDGLSVDGPFQNSIRSKIPVSMETVERHWKKQKLESSSMRGELEKEDTVTDMACDVVSNNDEVCGETSESVQNQTVSKKSRIPSKKNPQPELHGWLSIFQEWGHAEKLLALDELMALCDPTQVRHVMQVIEPQFQRDFISLLPKELALYVLSFLEPRDLLRAAQTCTYWHSLAEDNLLWREKCQEGSVTEALVYPSGRRGRVAHSVRGDKSTWKGLYLRQKQIEHNWRTVTRTPKVLKGHDDHVITCLEFSGNKIVSGSDDNTLKVWSAVTGRCLRTLTGHTGGVWSSQMSGSIIISGSTDRTLKVWNADTGHCKHTLYGHTSTVRCMHLHNKRVVSGSRDATLRLWDIDTGQCLHILIGHVAAVRCVQYDGHRVISGGYDYMVKIWDPETETCLQTLAGHTNRVYSLQFDGTHIVSGSLDTSIRVWNSETGVCIHTLIGHQSLTSGMELKDNILVSGNADSTVKVWNIMTGQCLQTLQGQNKHQSAVTCLQFNGTLIITSSDDGTVKLWDMKTGEFIRNLVALESGGSGGVVWRIRCNNTKLVCAVGSRNGTEETKLLVIDFDVQDGEVTSQSTGNITNGE